MKVYMEKIRSEVLSQGASILTFCMLFRRSDKMCQKIVRAKKLADR